MVNGFAGRDVSKFSITFRMNTRHHKKLVHEGHYVAEVDVELIQDDDAWSPYLSLDDTEKLDEVRKALLRSDLKKASELAEVFELTPVRF
jgi:hypothetical protein